MEAANSSDRIFAIILAAGTGSRFGRLKQIEPVGSTCLAGIVVRNALLCEGIDRVVLVLGHEAETVIRALRGIVGDGKLEIVINREYSKGLSTSLRAGLKRARVGNCDAVIFLLGDMPMIDTGLLDTVIESYRSSNCRLCYVKTNGRAGHPVIARKDLFDEFSRIRGDIGGREVIQRNLEYALVVEVEDKDGIYQLDINNPKDLEVYLSRCPDCGD